VGLLPALLVSAAGCTQQWYHVCKYLTQRLFLRCCRRLRELSIRDNFSIEWTSLLAVLPICKVRACPQSTGAQPSSQHVHMSCTVSLTLRLHQYSAL
jgi:hypothetical protein